MSYPCDGYDPEKRHKWKRMKNPMGIGILVCTKCGDKGGITIDVPDRKNTS